jgi:hypothetical protein
VARHGAHEHEVTRVRYDVRASRGSGRTVVADAGGRFGATADGEADTPPHRTWASRVALLLVVLLGTGLVGLHIHSYRQLSQYDEAQHVDYVYNLLQGHVPASGDRWLPATTLAVACRTIDSPFPYPPCDPSSDNGSMPNYGLTTEFQQPPLYYVGPAAAVWASAHLLPGHLEEISVMRTTGALWLAAGLILLWLLWRELGVPWLPRVGLSLALVAAPTLLLAQSTVNNDGTALAAGAAIALATVRWAAGRAPMWVPLALVVVALMLKVTNVAVLLMACTFVLIRQLQQSGRARQKWRSMLTPRTLAFVGVCGAATFAVALGWSAIQDSRATVDPMDIVQNMVMRADHFDPGWLVSALPSLLSPLSPEWLPSVMEGVIGSSVGHVVNAGLLLLAIVGAVRARPGSVVRALAIATGAAALAFGPLMVLGNYAALDMYFEIPARYGFSLVPAMAAVAGTAVRSRLGHWALFTVGAALYLAVAVQLLL